LPVAGNVVPRRRPNRRSPMTTIFEKYGGFSTISRIVMDFYGRVLDSEIAAPYFDEIDMARLMDHQTKFIAQVMGGPAAYSDEALQRVHAGRGIDRTAFDEVADLLSQTLSDHGVQREDVAYVRAHIDEKARFIIDDANRGAAG